MRNFHIGKPFFLAVWLSLPQFVFSLMQDGKKKDDKNEGCISLDFPWPLILSSGGYNKEHLPRSLPITNNGVPEPVKISVSGVVQTVSPIIASESEFRVNMKFVLHWRDTRLSTEHLCNMTELEDSVMLPEDVAKLIWLPTPYIVNAKYEEVKKLTRRLASVKLYKSGTVTLSMVVNATVDCAMDFQWYPMDSQLCPMHIESFLYDTFFVEYNWIQDKPFLIIPRRLIQFDVEPVIVYAKSLSYKKQIDRNFTRLTAYFRFTRIGSNHLIQTFIPSTLIVILSWFSFWLELDVTSARTSLLSISMLTLVTQFWSLHASLPPVAYVMAVDIWMLGCMIAIYAAVAEFALVKSLYAITQEMRKENRVQDLTTMSFISEGRLVPNADSRYNRDSYEDLNKVLYPGYLKKRLGSVVLSGRSTATSYLPSRVECSILFGTIRVPLIWTTSSRNSGGNSHVIGDEVECHKMMLWRKVDMVSKVVFPVVFFIFCFVYWAALLIFGGVASNQPDE